MGTGQLSGTVNKMRFMRWRPVNPIADNPLKKKVSADIFIFLLFILVLRLM
jgi:hypothetical protein